MTYLKSIRIAGFCLVAMFAVSMYMSSSAMATWEELLDRKSSGSEKQIHDQSMRNRLEHRRLGVAGSQRYR